METVRHSKVSVQLDPRASARKAERGTAVAWLAQRLRDSAWAALLGKALLGAVVFAALALVGSGQALGWLPGRSSASLRPGASTTPSTAAPASSAAPVVALVPADSSAPRIASPPSAAPTAVDPTVVAPASAITPDGKVILNLASEVELRRLPSIGAKRAHSIVELRTRLGKLKRVEDLLRVKGIGRKLLARLRPLVLVDAPVARAESAAPAGAKSAAGASSPPPKAP
jgi:competence protein ComEA